jgi:hypothetical protein
MAFPLMNQISLGITAAGASLIMISLVIGQFGTGGWTAYPPYTELAFSPGEGVDYWIWAVVISGLGSHMSGINFSVPSVRWTGQIRDWSGWPGPMGSLSMPESAAKGIKKEKLEVRAAFRCAGTFPALPWQFPDFH